MLLINGTLNFYMGKVTRVRKKLVGSEVFLKLVRPLVFSDLACAEDCVVVSTTLDVVLTDR